MTKTRDEVLVQIAKQVQAAPRKQKKLIAGRGYKLIHESTDDARLMRELREEFEAIAWPSA